MGSLKLEDLEKAAKKQRYGKNSHISLQGDEKVQSRNVTTADTLMDLIRQMFPPNLIQVETRHQTPRQTDAKTTRHPDKPDIPITRDTLMNHIFLKFYLISSRYRHPNRPDKLTDQKNVHIHTETP